MRPALILCYLVHLASSWALYSCPLVAGKILIQRAEPPSAEQVEEMKRWIEHYEREMGPVREHWRRIEGAIHGGKISALQTLCPGFRAEVAGLDHGALLQVQDVAIRANLRRAFELLERASQRCDRRRFFALSFRLYEARYIVEAIDRRLEVYR